MRTRRDVRGEKKKEWKECSSLPRDHPRNRFSPSIHFSATRKNSTHGTLWRLCARTARLVESCSKNNSLAYDIRAGRLVSSSRVASRPLAGQMTGTHVFSHWHGPYLRMRDPHVRAGERENGRAREEGKREETEGAEWPRGLPCVVSEPPHSLPFPQNPRAYRRFPSAFLLFSSRPILCSFSHYRDEPAMKITSIVVVSYTPRKPITVRSLSLLNTHIYVCVYVNAWPFCFSRVAKCAIVSKTRLATTSRVRPIRKVSSYRGKRIADN